MDSEASDVPIVGIGASAGGVKALQAFFAAIPDETGAAFVVVVHLDPAARSELAGILGSRTPMQVRAVEKTMKLEANQVYVTAPNRNLRIADHTIFAPAFEDRVQGHAPIDFFFRSLAEHHKNAFAIILTGAGADGTIGVKAIKEAGGIVLIQDPTEAEYASMPRSAIAAEVADFILPLGQLVERLDELLRTRLQLPPEQLQESDEETIRRILGHVRVRTGHDFNKYKRATVVRRIARRAQLVRKESLADYYAYLRDNVEEAQSLFSDFLISVTTFFRDAASFGALAEQVMPQLFDGGQTGETIRVWVPGCATGEEAYTVGILFLEEAARRDVRPEIQVFGSDLDEGALAIAREGRFPVAIETDLSEERLRRFFTREGHHYRVRRELRDIVLFASHSLLRDPPFSRLDLITCRNLLIYLDRDLQQQACNTFHYALNPGGFLLLGSSESADQPGGLFRTVDRDARIYKSTGRSGDKRLSLPILVGSRQIAEPGTPPPRAPTISSALSDAALHRQMLEKVAPPSMVVDETHRVIHLSENAGRFLQPAGGPVSSDASDLVRPELRFDLRTALHRAFERGETTLTMPIPVRFNGTPHRVYLQVKPVQLETDAVRHTIVMFFEGDAVDADVQETSAVHADGAPQNEIIRQLQQELQLSQSRLRATREEAESANEELRAANEELQSINEEYRSTSEELETSKEELQSINEELQTVNNELKLKLESVSRAHSDLQNLMAATEFGTLFLDQRLRIKRFTPRLTELFNVTVNDEGRSITDFTHQLNYDGIADHARKVPRDLTPIEHEVQSRGGGWYLVRMRPYRTVDDKIDGVVATFVDITERRQVEEALRKAEDRVKQETRLVDLARSPMFVWDLDGAIVQWNRGSEELYGFARDEALGKVEQDLLQTAPTGPSLDDLRQNLVHDGSWTGRLSRKSKDGRALVVECQLELISAGAHRLVVERSRDISDRQHPEVKGDPR